MARWRNRYATDYGAQPEKETTTENTAGTEMKAYSRVVLCVRSALRGRFYPVDYLVFMEEERYPGK